MNKIEVLAYKTEYSDKAHLVFTIDSKPLDILLCESLHTDDYIGLVPSVSWLDRPQDKDFSLSRLFPELGTKTIAPVLVCPDDRDLWCTVIVAEVELTHQCVVWHRLGLDRTEYKWEPTIGNKVDWFESIEPFQFDTRSYK